MKSIAKKVKGLKKMLNTKKLCSPNLCQKEKIYDNSGTIVYKMNQLVRSTDFILVVQQTKNRSNLIIRTKKRSY